MIVYGKEGRPSPGLSDLSPLLSTLRSAGALTISNMDALANMMGLEGLKTIDG